MTTISSMADFEAIPSGQVITIVRAGLATEQWRRREDNDWLPVGKEETGVPLASRYFKGAVESGIVRLALPGETPADTDTREWKVGNWWIQTAQPSTLYLVTSEDTSGSDHNCLQVQDARVTKAVLYGNTITNEENGYRRLLPGEPFHHERQWFVNWIEAIKATVVPTMPEDFVGALREFVAEYEGEYPMEELADLLTENGVDMSVTVPIRVAGQSTITPADYAGLLGGAVTVLDSEGTWVAWERTFEVKIKRGCTCGEDWMKRVLNENDVLSSLPLNRDEDFEVTLPCPVHEEAN